MDSEGLVARTAIASEAYQSSDERQQHIQTMYGRYEVYANEILTDTISIGDGGKRQETVAAFWATSTPLTTTGRGPGPPLSQNFCDLRRPTWFCSLHRRAHRLPQWPKPRPQPQNLRLLRLRQPE